MAYTEIVITRFGDHLVSMLLKDGHPVEFQCVSEKNKVDIGNIYIGIVKNVVKNINGAFVEFDQDEIGFLSMRHRQYKAGDEVLVQIKKEATEEKRPMLSDQIELTGKYLVLTSDKLSVGISNKIHQKEKKQELKEMAEQNRKKRRQQEVGNLDIGYFKHIEADGHNDQGANARHFIDDRGR